MEKTGSTEFIHVPDFYAAEEYAGRKLLALNQSSTAAAQKYPWTDCLPANIKDITTKMASIANVLKSANDAIASIGDKVSGLSTGFAAKPPDFQKPRNVLNDISKGLAPLAIPLNALEQGARGLRGPAECVACIGAGAGLRCGQQRRRRICPQQLC